MFSGIVESTSLVVSSALSQDGLSLTLRVSTPPNWNDLQVGDSIAVNGLCLTLENEDHQSEMQFTMGAETLRVLTAQGQQNFRSQALVNLERSLRLGDRVHGHLVSGHVDELVEVLSRKVLGESLELNCALPQQKELRPFIWKKGSVTVNGVSLTVNEVTHNSFQVCLIPETQRRTNLSGLSNGTRVCLETDWLAKSMIAHRNQKEE